MKNLFVLVICFCSGLLLTNSVSADSAAKTAIDSALGGAAGGGAIGRTLNK